MDFLKNKTMKIYTLIVAILVIASDICYMAIDCSQYITKTIASSIFLIFGIVNLILTWNKQEYMPFKKFNLFLTLGLLFAFLGDILLISSFVIGASLFALGHIFFLISFISLKKFNYLDITIGSAIFIVCMLIILLLPIFNFDGMAIVVYLYALIISFMLGKALSNFIQDPKNKKALFLFLGAFLFFFSDLMLLFHIFADVSPIFDIFCLATYYPAEFLLGLSIFILPNQQLSK